MIDVYDSQVKIIDEKIVPWIQFMQMSPTNLEDFRLRVIDLFRDEANLDVEVKCWWTDEVGTIGFDIEVYNNRMPWDPQQQAHEVQHNVLDIPEDRGKGAVKVDKGLVEAIAQGDTQASSRLHLPGH